VIRDKLLVEKNLKILKDELKGCVGLIDELEKQIKEMEFTDGVDYDKERKTSLRNL